jgi:hypothetical protein
MENELKISVKEESRDRYARLTRTRIGQKVIQTPSFCIQLQDPDELDLLIRLKEQYPCDRLETNVVRFVDIRQAFWRLHPKTPHDVFMHVRKDKYSLFFEKQILLLDKSLEYLYYQPRMRGFVSNPYTPRTIIQYIDDIEHLRKETEVDSGKRKSHKSFESKRDAHHREFWRGLADETSIESNRKRFDLIRSFLQCDLDYNADVVLPPVPLIDSEEMLEIAQKMNNDTKELARGKKHCASFFLFKSSALADWPLLDKALRYLAENSSESLTVIKFKYLDLTVKDSQTERDNYREFMSNLEFFTRTFKNRACVALENNCQSYVSPVAGFDIVSSSFTNHDIEYSFGKYAPYGKWLDPTLLIQRPWADMKKMYTLHGVLPHSCGICKSVKVRKLDDLKPDEWYVIRRGHVALFMNEWLGYIQKAIKEDKNIELVTNRLANSKVQILKDLLPRNW